MNHPSTAERMTSLMVGTTDVDILLRHIINKDGWVRRVDRAATRSMPRVKLAQLAISKPAPIVPDNRSWWRRMKDRWFRPKGRGLIWHSRDTNVYSQPSYVPEHCLEGEEEPGLDYPRWKDWALLGGLFALSVWLFYLWPELMIGIVVVTVVVLAYLGLRE